MHKFRLLSLLPLLLGVLSASGQSFSPADYVNPMIGTGGHGHTFPGVSVPFGMVQLSPDTRLDGWDGCSAYHNSDTVIYGFSHTHLSGTGCSDYGDILLMPVRGVVKLAGYGYASPFKKSEEHALPGYYSVWLEKYGIRAELTATARTGMHRYTYPASDAAGIVLDLVHRDQVLESGVKVISNTEIEGFRVSRAWAPRQMVYFVARFSKPFSSFTIESDEMALQDVKEANGKNIRALFRFSTNNNETVVVKVGISGVSMEGARKNLDAENEGWDFDLIRAKAMKAWNVELGKILVEDGTPAQMKVFYTALYHTMLQPNVYSDVDGRYRGRDLKIHEADNFDYYTVFSLWDTYRAAHPLYTLVDQKRTVDFIKTFIRQYEEGGALPVWELSSNETGCMIGYHAVPVIADAYLKGITGFDAEKALEAMKHSAELDHLGLKHYKSKGYIPADQEGESVSKTLEYAYDDWCIAMMAKAMGKEDDYRTYIKRAQNYKNLFDRSTGFMRAKLNETWFSPFDPSEVNFNYTEANAWQYSFYVPHDLEGLMILLGGRERFSQKLDALFSADSKTTGRDQADISGLIGQYAHGNEPSHHMAYLYDYAAEPWKSQELVHRICKEFYLDQPDGLIGNEDCGQMSSWFVFSAMGFYPVTPGAGLYAIGTPLFPDATISLENGKKFRIRANSLNENNFYIQSATLNGKPYSRCYLLHSDIMKGGELVFNMGAEPNKAWGIGAGGFPFTRISDQLITPVPAVQKGERTFIDSTIVSLSSPVSGTIIHYTLDGKEPTLKSGKYFRPFIFRKSTTLKAFAFKQGVPPSNVITAEFVRIPGNRKITLKTGWSGQYAAGGDVALINGIRGGENFRTGTWQGYEGDDVEAVVDLGSAQPVKSVSLGALQDQDSWIFMPEKVLFSYSADGVNFTEMGSVSNDTDAHAPGSVQREFTMNFKQVNARYIRVVAKNRGVCPSWHLGAGKKAWIFVDEITIE